MYLRIIKLALAALALSTFAMAQSDGPFQVKTFSNVNLGGSYVNFTNTGATGGNICVNVYSFAPDEQEMECCACQITPDSLWSLNVLTDLDTNNLTKEHPNSVVVKLLATVPPVAGNCDARTPGANAVGLGAWGTTIHLFGAGPTPVLTETGFLNSTISDAEKSTIAGNCVYIHTLGSGNGICAACDITRNRGLGADKQ
jgi:hypothetical protein